ncbi:hypothetical protein THAOC_34985 [Thalassiosira oceanica]|uniref:Abscisic acid G-protein coupled receptor-like domain-containing protein n=1 Tax=Thalassiosira oceanica TaxID=159749 RepID=K0R1L8_THAOC|nr:hypothetical protein THAOC_34985 [Thalassiosira oceanica]|eukprot:EJK46348.1 hypothetical protein THAOC_34985 [Thalassiosira oceanica]
MRATFLFSVLLIVVSSAASFSSGARATRCSPIIRKRKTALDLSGVSSASANALLARGGGEQVLKSFYGDALGYFGGIRTPATFLAGSSLAAIFTLKGAASKLASDDSSLSGLEKFAIKAYHVLAVMAFVLSLNTVVTATVAHTSVLHGRFDQVGETAYTMMKREFLYEFDMTRWSFLSSMFCFLGMVLSRLLFEFELLKVGSFGGAGENLAMLLLCIFGALITNLMSFVNQNLWCWSSLIGMTRSVVELVLDRAFVQKRPLQVISVLFTLGSAFYIGKLVGLGDKEKQNDSL